MRIPQIIVIIFLASGSLSGQSMGESYARKISKELGKWSDQYSGIEFIKNQDSRELYKLTYTGNNDTDTLILSSAQGRYEKFDMMTVIQSGQIKLITILKYRSEYGSEISNRKWLSQFYSVPDSTFVFRKNIDAISGATFSAQGIIEELNNILTLIAEKDW